VDYGENPNDTDADPDTDEGKETGRSQRRSAAQ